MKMAKRRYIVELTEPQILRLFAALELFEMDLTGTDGFDYIEKQYRTLHRNTENALNEGYSNGLKTIKTKK